MSDIAFSVIVGNGYDDIIFKTIMLKGDKGNSVASVEKTSTSGLVDTYTVYLTDGTVGGTFTVTNGSPVNIDDTATALDKTWSSSKLSGMIKEIDDTDVDADKLWSSEKIDSMIAQTGRIEDVAIATITDGADDLPLVKCKAQIEPYQAGSGEPSPTNVRAISGWNSVAVTRTGKNLLAKPFIYNDNDNLDNLSECFFIKKGTYIASFGSMTNATNWRFIVRLKDASGNNLNTSDYVTFNTGFQWSATRKAWINGANTTAYSCIFTLNQDCYIRILFGVGNTSSSSIASNPQLELGTTATTYEAYTGTTATVALPETIYSGEADVVGGSGTNTFSNRVDLGSLNWTVYNNKMIYLAFPNAKAPLTNNDKANILCEQYKTVSRAEVGYGQTRLVTGIGIDLTGNLFVVSPDDETWTDLQSAKASLSGVYFCYELATPTTFSVTPASIKTKANQTNSFFVDTGNINELIYFKSSCDTTAEMFDILGKSEAENITYDNTSSGLTSTDVQDAIDELDGSVDALTTEVTGIRTGFDGTVYASAGEAVRGQVSDINADMSNFESIAGCYFKTLDFDLQQLVWYNNNGTIASNSSGSYWRSIKLNVTAGEAYRLSFNTHGVNYVGILFGNNGTYIDSAYTDTADHTTTYIDELVFVPTGANEMYVNCYTDFAVMNAKKAYFDADARFGDSSLAGANFELITSTIQSYVYRITDGQIAQSSGASNWRSAVFDVTAGEIYKISTMIYGSATYGILLANADGYVLAKYLLVGTNTTQTITDYLVKIPANATKMYVNCRLPSDFAGTINVKKAFFDLDYVTDIRTAEAQALAKMQGYNRTNRFLNFGFITDTHLNDSPNALVNLKSLSRIAKSKNLDAIFHGGDYITTTDISTLDGYFEAEYEYMNAFKTIDDMIFIQGNHDVGHSTTLANDASVTQFNIMFGINGNGATKNSSEPFNDYWYKDYADFKIRIICLESFNLDGSHGISSTQVTWLTNVAFNVPSDYTVVILTHFINEDDNHWYTDAVNAISTFMASHNLACVICGHRHAQMYDNSNGFGIILVDAGFNSYSLFTIDTANKVVYETSIGAEDRAFHYGNTPADNYQITE